MRVGAFIEFFTRRGPESDPAFRAEINETARRGLIVLGVVEVGFAALAATRIIAGGASLALVLSALGAIALGCSRSTGRARAIALTVALATLIAFTIHKTQPLNSVSILIVVVAAIPGTPLQIALLGAALIAGVLASAVGAEALASLVTIVLIAILLASFNYTRLDSRRTAHMAALLAAEKLRTSELRTCYAENASSTLRLAATLSHDLNSPVGALRSSVDTLIRYSRRLATDAEDRSRMSELGGVIDSALTRIEETVRRMQRFTNLDGAEKQRVHVNSLIEDVVALSLAPEERQLRVRLRLGDAPFLIAERQALGGALAALLMHALKVPADGARLEIQTGAHDDDVEIAFRSDNPKWTPAIDFNPGFAIADAKVRSANLDVFNAREVIRAHGGDVSTDARSQTLVIRLPAENEEAKSTASCEHLRQAREIQPRTQGCEECLKSGDSWVHLRLCLTCGHVGCCDSSKNKHATKHFHDSRHPVVQSAQPGEGWRWCYLDEAFEERTVAASN